MWGGTDPNIYGPSGGKYVHTAHGGGGSQDFQPPEEDPLVFWEVSARAVCRHAARRLAFQEKIPGTRELSVRQCSRASVGRANAPIRFARETLYRPSRETLNQAVAAGLSVALVLLAYRQKWLGDAVWWGLGGGTKGGLCYVRTPLMFALRSALANVCHMRVAYDTCRSVPYLRTCLE